MTVLLVLLFSGLFMWAIDSAMPRPNRFHRAAAVRPEPAKRAPAANVEPPPAAEEEVAGWTALDDLQLERLLKHGFRDQV